MSFVTSVTLGAFGGERERDRENTNIILIGTESKGKYGNVGVIELHADGAAGLVDRDRLVEAAVLDAKFVQAAQRSPGEISEFGMVPLALKLGDDDQRKDYLVFGEPHKGRRVCEKDRGVQYVGVRGGRIRGRGICARGR